jgi:hypothetical protein
MVQIMVDGFLFRENRRTKNPLINTMRLTFRKKKNNRKNK